MKDFMKTYFYALLIVVLFVLFLAPMVLAAILFFYTHNGLYWLLLLSYIPIIPLIAATIKETLY